MDKELKKNNIPEEEIEKMMEKIKFLKDNSENGEALVVYGIAVGMAIANNKKSA